MRNGCYIICFFCAALCLTACAGTGVKFDGSRTGNDSQLIMEYEMFDTTDSQTLVLQAGDSIHADITVDSGALSIIIQKDDDTSVYEGEGILSSGSFDVVIEEDGEYTVTVTGEKTKGGVSFVRVAPQG